MHAAAAVTVAVAAAATAARTAVRTPQYETFLPPFPFGIDGPARPAAYAEDPGTVYLLHAERPIGNRRHSARHYIGWGSDLHARLNVQRKAHRDPRGARLVAAWNGAGIRWAAVRTWRGGRALERRLKARKNAARLCPVCRAAAKAAREATGSAAGDAGGASGCEKIPDAGGTKPAESARPWQTFVLPSAHHAVQCRQPGAPGCANPAGGHGG